MSRIGKKPVVVPEKVKVVVKDGVVRVDGPKGQMFQPVTPKVTVSVEGGRVSVIRSDDARSSRAQHGLMRALIQNMVTGVSQGFERNLEIVGIGYKADIAGNVLTLNLGYSHPVVYTLPAGVSVDVEKGTKLSVRGFDRQIVGETAAKIRQFRPPDAYKGKGIRFSDEVIKVKAGKSGSSGK